MVGSSYSSLFRKVSSNSQAVKFGSGAECSSCSCLIAVVPTDVFKARITATKNVDQSLNEFVDNCLSCATASGICNLVNIGDQIR